jgi:hypothetical protein
MTDGPKSGDASSWAYIDDDVLKAAAEAYVRGHEELQPEQIAVLCAYFRRRIFLPVWRGDELAELRRTVDGLNSRAAINAWLDACEMAGIDPR